MAKILKFPTGEELKQKAEAKKIKEDYDTVRDASDECVTTAQFLLEVLEEFILTGESSHNFMDMQFRDEAFQESRDMFVIVNMLNAMFHRYYGIPHSLHREFDRLYAMIKLMDKQNSQAKDELDGKYEILFTPDDGEDDDTT
jgi:hypothetical protein